MAGACLQRLATCGVHNHTSLTRTVLFWDILENNDYWVWPHQVGLFTGVGQLIFFEAYARSEYVNHNPLTEYINILQFEKNTKSTPESLVEKRA